MGELSSQRDDDVVLVGRISESCPVVQCKVNGCPMEFLVDTGAGVTLVGENCITEMQKRGFQSGDSFDGPCGTFVGVTGEPISLKGQMRLKFTLGASEFEHVCLVCPEQLALPEKVSGILGQDILSARGVEISFADRVIRIDGQEVPIIQGPVVNLNGLRLSSSQKPPILQ